jgi:hypothetical protein
MARMKARRRSKTPRGRRRTKRTRTKLRRTKARKPRPAKAPKAERVRAALRKDRTMTRADRRRVEAMLPAIHRISGA